MTLQPTSAEIHLWLTPCEAIIEEGLLTAYRELLSAAEKQEESRFIFARDRHRYLITRALVRTVLSRYAPVDPKEWVFSTDGYGRPHIINTQATNSRLSFSVSHTQGLIVLAVAKGLSLGVDVENFTTRDIPIDVANQYFAPQEVAALHDVPHQQRQYRFFEIWTLKESYIKARGTGFSLPLDSFSLHFRDDYAVDLVSDDSSRWQLWQFRPTSEHLVAVCAEKLNAQSSRLLARETTLTVSDGILAPEFLRTSEIRHKLHSRTGLRISEALGLSE